MKVEYVNPFIISAVEVFEKVARIELKKSGVQLKKNTHPSNEICVVINISGDFIGQVVYSFKRHTAERVVSSMMPDSPPDKQMEYLESALSSLANMITGRATILLAGKEKVIYITPPEIIIDKNVGNHNFLTLPTISAEFTSRFGTLEINVALKEIAKSG